MKVAVECRSPLMQKSLELFLGNHLCSMKNSEIILRDERCLNDSKCFYISSDEDADLLKPFSKSQLILALEKKLNQDIFNEYAPLDFEILEQRIESLTQEYQANILKVVRAFYEE